MQVGKKSYSKTVFFAHSEIWKYIIKLKKWAARRLLVLCISPTPTRVRWAVVQETFVVH